MERWLIRNLPTPSKPKDVADSIDYRDTGNQGLPNVSTVEPQPSTSKDGNNFEEEKDMGKCLKQLSHCYCINRRAENPLQLYVTNFCGKSKEEMARSTGYQNWDVYFHEENHTTVFEKKDLVYLTSDSENILSKLDDTKVYIIGAFVDHNKHKGRTLSVANEQEITHAQLPIREFLEMNTRKVLTIDHVFEILLHVSEGITWKEALLKVIPQRKGAVEKST
uniref:tRNA (guanine(9)-N(1))-methyltransferase n=1 Tax=Graphocephala atropunctata TaxID=36148 RepID=A0A1B6L5S2_9HEMI